MQAAGAASFDWDVTTGEIRWDGAADILPQHLDMTSAQRLPGRHSPPNAAAALTEVLNQRGMQSDTFLVDIEIAIAPWAPSPIPWRAPARPMPTAAPRASSG